jgi:hypothetical protein
MDSLITVAARALATGNPLNALNFIALRDDGPALALRGACPAHRRSACDRARPAGDGEAWSSSALALALGASQRTVQRALDELTIDGKVQAISHGRARRWMAPPVPSFPTTLLLSVALPALVI